MAGMAAGVPLRLQYKPVTRVENMCCTGSDALRNASYAVAARVYDVVLAIGVEKIKDQGLSGLQGASGAGVHTYPNVAPPGIFAMLATRYFARYGLSPEDGKAMIAKISVKSHHNGSLNPKAHLRRKVTVEQVLNAPIIAWPLGLFDCCGVSDGSAAAIVVRAEDAKKYRPGGAEGVRRGRDQEPPRGDKHGGGPRLLLDHRGPDNGGPPVLAPGQGERGH
jgi:acetyl-CoA C-acetyltransferase